MEVSCTPVWVSKGFRRQFSPLWRSCEASASLFECQDWFRKQSQDLHSSKTCFLNLSSSDDKASRYLHSCEISFHGSPDTQTGMHELHRTSRMVKKLVWASLGVRKDVESSFTIVLNLWSLSTPGWVSWFGSKIHYLPLLRPCEAHPHPFECWEDLEGSFDHCGSPVKLVEANLSVRKDRSWGVVKLVHASLNSTKGLQSNFDHCGRSAKLVHSSLTCRMDLEGNFHKCGGTVKLLYVHTVFTTVEVLWRLFTSV